MLVTNSDLVVKQEEKYVKLFVIFKDKKYGTKYVIFTDNDNKVLYYGSPLVNGNKMVIMKFKDIKDAENVKEFVWNYLNNESISNFDLIEIPKLDKLELIDCNTLEVKEEYVTKLIDIFFKKEEVITHEEEKEIKEKKKSKKGPVIFILILLLVGFGAFIYLKNNKELIYGKNIYVRCNSNYKESEIDANVSVVVDLTFNNSRLLKEHTKEYNLVFNDNDIYYDFKEKNLQYTYIEEEGVGKFIDDELTYKQVVTYNLNKNYNLPKGYDELFTYYQNNDYNCGLIQK